jgi:tetratricopeptide (TPR) repeat protein
MTREQKTDAMAAVLVNDMAIKSEKKGDLDRAIELYQKALALDSNNSVIRRNFAVAVNNRGIQIENSGDIDRALKYYQSALESKPNDLATAQAIAGNIQRVQDSIQRRANAWNLNNEGVKIEKTDLDGAIRLYQQASSLYPNDAIISGNLQRSKERKQRLLQDKSTADAVAEGQKIVAESIEKMTRGQGTSPDAPGPGMEFTGTPGNSEPVGLTFADVAAQMPDDMGDAPNSGVGKLSQFPNGNVQPDAKKLDETSSESGGTPAQGEELVSEGQRFGESLVDAAAGNAVVIMDGKNGAIKDPRGIRKLNLQGGPAKGGNLIRSTVAEGNCVVVTEKLMSSPEFGELVRDRDKKVETLRTFDKAVKALEQGEGVSSAPAALEELKQKLREAKDALTKTDQKILYVVKKANKREEVKTPPADDKTPETDDETLSPFDKQAADAIIKKVYDEPTTGEVGRRDGSREGKEK